MKKTTLSPYQALAHALSFCIFISCGISLPRYAGTGPKGWELTEGNTGLAVSGIDRNSLEPYVGPSKPVQGTSIVNKRVDTILDLSAGGISIERCWIRPLSISPGQKFIITYDVNNDSMPAPKMVIVRDCDIDGTGIASDSDVSKAVGFAGSGTVQRCNIFGMGTGIAIMNAGSQAQALPVLVEGNYIHDLRAYGDPATTGSHNEGFTVRDFAGSELIVANNRINCSSGNDTGDIFIKAGFGFIDNVLVTGNLLEGLNYHLILECSSYGYGRSMGAVDNRFGEPIKKSGYEQRFDSASGLSLDYGWAEWSDNFMNDPTAPENRGASVPVNTIPE